jgi:hypothetical protein
MKQVNPAAVPFTNELIFGIPPTFEFDCEDVEDGRVIVTFVRDEESERRGVGGCGVR